MEGYQLRALREKVDVTARQIAKTTGYTPEHISAVECGKVRLTKTVENACLLALHLIQARRNLILADELQKNGLLDVGEAPRGSVNSR